MEPTCTYCLLVRAPNEVRYQRDAAQREQGLTQDVQGTERISSAYRQQSEEMNTSNLTHQEVADINTFFGFLEKDQMYGELGIRVVDVIRRELPGLQPLSPEAAVEELRMVLLSILSNVGMNINEDKTLRLDDMKDAFAVIQRTNHLQFRNITTNTNKTTLKA